MPEQKNIRNIGIVAHVDAGKTTITEHILYKAGVIRTLGSVDKGTAHTDWLEVERTRGISVRAAATTIPWRDYTINLIDTPGHVDFSAEVERSLRVLDGAVLVLSAVEGVQAQTEVLWQALHAMKIPTILFINKIDRMGADVQRVLSEVRASLTPQAIAIQHVQNAGEPSPVITDLLSMPQAMTGEQQGLWEAMMEAVADHDEALLTAYLEGREITRQQLFTSLCRQAMTSRLYPVMFGAAIDGLGMDALMNAIPVFLPPPKGGAEAPLSGIVFKLERDRSMGRVAYVRLFQGSMKNRDSVYNHTRRLEEKISQIRRIQLQRSVDVGVLQAGDIGSIYGWNHAGVGDIIGSPEGIPEGHALAIPHLMVQVHPKGAGDEVRLVEALQELADEDPLLQLEWLRNEREIHVRIMGTIQLEVLASILKTRFGMEAAFDPPTVIYKETPARAGEGFEAYTMPKPCWAVVKLWIEPGERGSGLRFESQVRAEKMLPRYQNHVEKCLPEALQQGLYGWEVIDLKVTLVDGEHHNMHTHPMDFFVATPMAVMHGLVNTGTILLEPMLDFRISAPEESGGKIMSDLIQRRGQFDAPVIARGGFTVTGRIPVATVLDYPVRLSSITGGRGVFSTRFGGYQECPIELGAIAPRRGVNPLDRSKFILYARDALSQ